MTNNRGECSYRRAHSVRLSVGSGIEGMVSKRSPFVQSELSNSNIPPTGSPEFRPGRHPWVNRPSVSRRKAFPITPTLSLSDSTSVESLVSIATLPNAADEHCPQDFHHVFPTALLTHSAGPTRSFPLSAQRVQAVEQGLLLLPFLGSACTKCKPFKPSLRF